MSSEPSKTVATIPHTSRPMSEALLNEKVHTPQAIYESPDIIEHLKYRIPGSFFSNVEFESINCISQRLTRPRSPSLPQDKLNFFTVHMLISSPVGPLPLLNAHPFRPRSFLWRCLLCPLIQTPRMARLGWSRFRCWTSLGRV
jgi:hypothetical protein